MAQVLRLRHPPMNFMIRHISVRLRRRPFRLSLNKISASPISFINSQFIA